MILNMKGAQATKNRTGLCKIFRPKESIVALSFAQLLVHDPPKYRFSSLHPHILKQSRHTTSMRNILSFRDFFLINLALPGSQIDENTKHRPLSLQLSIPEKRALTAKFLMDHLEMKWMEREKYCYVRGSWDEKQDGTNDFRGILYLN